MSTSSNWELRYPSPDLVRHYRDSGWWNDDTLTEIAFRGVVTSSSVRCRVRSHVHPFTGTIGDVGDMGRRLAGDPRSSRHRVRRRRRLPAPELGRGGRLLLRAALARRGGRADRPHLRVEGDGPHPAPEPGPRAHHRRPLRPAGLRGEPRGGRRRTCPDLETVVVVSADGAPTPKLGTTVLSWSDALDGDPLEPAPTGRPRQPRARRLHLGHHRRAEGCDPHPPQLSGRPAHVGHLPG